MRRLALACAFAGAAAACGGGGGDRTPVRIGLSASLTGADAPFGQVARQVTEAAVAEVNRLGGVDGHLIELIVVDDESEAGSAAAAIGALIDEGVVGIVGPFLSGQVAEAIPLVVPAEIVLVSPSSTAPELVHTPPDQGYLFRTAPNDTFQVLAMSHYFLERAAPPVTTFAIVHEEGSYGEGLAQALSAEWARRGRGITGTPIAYPVGLDGDALVTAATWDAIVAAAPSHVVLIGLGSDANVLIRTWKASGQLPALSWFLSDAIKSSSLFGEGETELPASAAGLRGTAPTPPRDGLAFRAFVDVVGAAAGDEGFMPNTWDAVYLLAGGLMTQAAAGEPFGGAGLRDAVAEVSRGGQIFHAGQWRDFVGQIERGRDVDYDGASGPCDFDADGETITPYEVWEIRHDAGGWRFVQVDYIETRDLVED